MNHNDPAFPETEHGFEVGHTGLTKREYFAGFALCQVRQEAYMEGSLYASVAEQCVKFADALIAELSKPADK
jgi:hypothetical protein